NKPIMQYQIEVMKRIGITDITIVVGHLKNKITEFFKDGKKLGVKISYVEQKEALGIAHAVGQLENCVHQPFLLWLGDIFFIPENIELLLKTFKEKQACAVLAVKKEEEGQLLKKNFAVLLHESGMVKRVVEKPRYLHSNLKGCGIYLFDLNIFDAIRRTPRTAMRDEYEITNSIQILIEDGFPVYPAQVIQWDMNITYATDLLACNQFQLKLLGENSIIGNNVKIHPKAEIKRSVIGNNVKVKYPIKIVDSAILDNVSWSLKQDIEQSLVTMHSLIKEVKNEL
ncbi:MAG: sugar phosphate nucleotidyltransferase, partial [Candidatus Omnitrophota bacterium]